MRQEEFLKFEENVKLTLNIKVSTGREKKEVCVLGEEDVSTLHRPLGLKPSILA